MHIHSDSKNSFGTCALIAGAAAIGFGIGALCIARSGAENRAALKERFSNKGMHTTASEIKDIVDDTIPKVDSDEGEPKTEPEKGLSER